MIRSAQLGVAARQTTTTTSDTGAQQFALAMNNASPPRPQPYPTPNPQPGPPPGNPSGHYQCNGPLFRKGMAEYAVAGTEAAVVGGYAAQASAHDGPVAGLLVAGLGAVLTSLDLVPGTIDVVQSNCV